MSTFSFRSFPCLMAGCLVTSVVAGPAAAEEASTSPAWYERAFQQLETTWEQGQPELYIPLHTHHIRSSYSQEKIDSFNETPWGLGLGKGYYDQKGDWRGVYAMAFQDSHSLPEYMVGYGYKTFWPLGEELKFGLGYTAFVTARADIGHYTPFPAVLPLASLEYQKISLDTVYVPGGHGRGNVLFFWGKVRF